MNIKILRMLNGDDVIAEVDVQVTRVNMKNPFRVVVMPNAAGQSPNVGFAPWAPFSKETGFKLDIAHVVAIMEPIDEFVQQYKVTVSPIVTPPQGRLILPKK
jgi:hypothetical protein